MDPYAWSWIPEALTIVPVLTLGYLWVVRRFPATAWRIAGYMSAMALLLVVTITPVETIALHYLLSGISSRRSCWRVRSAL